MNEIEASVVDTPSLFCEDIHCYLITVYDCIVDIIHFGQLFYLQYSLWQSTER